MRHQSSRACKVGVDIHTCSSHAVRSPDKSDDPITERHFPLPLLPIIRGVSWRHIGASLAVLVTPGVLAVATDRLLVR